MGFAEAAAARLVPPAFREFLPFVSPSGLRVIHKERVLSLALQAMGRTLNGGVHDESVRTVRASLEKAGLGSQIKVVGSLEGSSGLSEGDAEKRKRIGESILTLYFHLVGSKVPLFLDLRPSHFGWDPEKNILLWVPSRLSYERSPEFLEKVVLLYRGFFQDDSSATQQGLSLYSWESSAKEGFDERIESLMRQHFGDARSTAVLFSIDHFKNTFHKVFEEAIRSEARFHPELTFLGTLLVGLYLTLDKVGVPLDVKKAFDRGMPQ